MAGFGSPASFELSRRFMDPGDPAGRYRPNDPPVKPGGGGSEVDTDDTKIINRIKETYEYERRVRMPHEVLWDKAIDRVNNRNPLFDKKASWQARKMLPAMPILCFTLAWEFTKQIILAGNKWFEPEAVNPTWKDYSDIWRDFLLQFLHPGGADPQNEFSTFIFDSVFMALQCQNMHGLVLTENDGIVDTTPTVKEAMEEETPDPIVPEFGFGSPTGALPPTEMPPLPGDQPFKLRIECMHPRYMYLDSSNSRSATYKLWIQTLKPGEFREYAEAGGWRNVEEIISQCHTSSQAAMDKAKDARDKMEGAEAKRLDTVELFHFFGTLFDERGEVIFKNRYCIIAGSYVTYGPVDNPCWHGKIPIVSSGLLRKPFTTYHDSLLTLNIDSQDARVELLNMLLDYVHWAINPPTEVDHDQLHQARGNQLLRGVFPGLVLHLQKQNRNFPAVQRMQGPSGLGDVWQAVGVLKQEMTEFTGAGGTAAMPRTRNRITAQEAKERMAQSGGVVEQVFRNFQSNYLEPILYQAYLLLLQKCPQVLWKSFLDEKLTQFKDKPEIVSTLTAMKEWTAQKRFQMLGAVFRFKVKVYSATESRRETLEKLGMFSEAAAMLPGMAARVRWQHIAEEYARALELDPNMLLFPDEGATTDQPLPVPAPEASAGGPPNPVGVVPPPPR